MSRWWTGEEEMTSPGLNAATLIVTEWNRWVSKVLPRIRENTRGDGKTLAVHTDIICLITWAKVQEFLRLNSQYNKNTMFVATKGRCTVIVNSTHYYTPQWQRHLWSPHYSLFLPYFPQNWHQMFWFLFFLIFLVFFLLCPNFTR